MKKLEKEEIKKKNKQPKEARKQQVARERPRGEEENQAHKDFDPATVSNGW